MPEFEIGDLVKLKSYCRHSDKLALVVEKRPCQTCMIKFVGSWAGEAPVLALETNLVLVQGKNK